MCVTPESSTKPTKNTAFLHRQAAVPIACRIHGCRSTKVGTRTKPLTFFPFKQINDPDYTKARAMKCCTGMPPLVCFQRTPRKIFSPQKTKHQKSFPFKPGTPRDTNFPYAFRQVMAVTSPRRWPERCREHSCPRHQSCCPSCRPGSRRSCRQSMLSKPSARLSSAALMRSAPGPQRC